MRKKRRRSKKNKQIIRKIPFLIALLGSAVLIVLLVVIFLSDEGLQSSSRDTERKADMSFLSLSLRSYFSKNLRYPSLSELNDPFFRKERLANISPSILKDPRWTNGNNSCTVGGAPIIESSTSPAPGCYAYQPLPLGCDNSISNYCKGYTISAVLESGSIYYVSSTVSEDK